MVALKDGPLMADRISKSRMIRAWISSILTTGTQTTMCRMDKQHGPTVTHRELYSLSCDKPSWKRV